MNRRNTNIWVAHLDRKPRRVLVIEDSEVVMNFIVKMLSDFYEVMGTSYAAECAYLAKMHNFDLMITDYLMPEMNGLQVLDEVRAVKPRLLVLVISGGGFSWELVVEAARREAHTLAKPFGDTLLPMVTAMFEYREREEKAAPK